MLRKSIFITCAFTSIALVSEPALAKDKDLGKKTQSEIAGICGQKGGTSFVSPGGANYGCGYEGGGGILCDKKTGCLETTRERDPIDPRWGLLGLLGLAGLIGVRGRDRHIHVDRRDNPAA